ncbi:Respiratory chain complex assembly or maintenance protein [Allomyces arbusculus]|nr:Respiratory chain complex assembly or maintenance protein [Allomyces arbusculus]
MHPTLQNPQLIQCAQIIEALEKCHKERTWAKFFGACNDLKLQLNDCLTEDYKARRAVNAADARARRQRAEETWSELDLK